MDDENRVATDGITPGLESASAPGPINPATGQHTSYWVLSEAERAKGFVRPVRDSYVHVGAPPNKYPLRDLTEEEKEQHAKEGYIKYEAYPESERPMCGRYWTQADLDRIAKGCGTRTTMSRPIAETYARDPHYYGSTFCVGCRTHLPVGKDGEFIWDDATKERVGT